MLMEVSRLFSRLNVMLGLNRISAFKWLRDDRVLIQDMHVLLSIASCDTDSCRVVACCGSCDVDAGSIV